LQPSTLTLVALVAVAIVAPVVWPSPRAITTDRLLPPSWSHPFGTTQLGQDVVAQVAHALRIDLALGVLAVGVSATIGMLLGALAGYLGGAFDRLFSAVADLTQALPVGLILLVLAFALGPGVTTIIVVFALFGWLPYARLARTEVARVRGHEYVQAAHLLGLSTPRILARHVAPNSVDQLAVYAAGDIGATVQTIAALAFVGVALPDRTIELGRMINTGTPRLGTAWWLTVFPGLVLVLIGVSCGRLASQIGASNRTSV
jgi:peptide/nickel transport system permease protein